jgi:hypothetical protein
MDKDRHGGRMSPVSFAEYLLKMAGRPTYADLRSRLREAVKEIDKYVILASGEHHSVEIIELPDLYSIFRQHVPEAMEEE